MLKTGGPASFYLFNDTISREEHKTIFSGLRISEMTAALFTFFHLQNPMRLLSGDRTLFGQSHLRNP
jgi:hypothetical protein